jgi:hypothetical protein
LNFSGIPDACRCDDKTDEDQPERAMENQKTNPPSENEAAIIIGKVLWI